MSDEIIPRRGFVRCLWGVPSKAYRRNSKVVNLDIEFIKYNTMDQPFTTYVFGKNNYKMLEDHGFQNCKLVSDDVSLWHWKDIKSKKIDQYGHKLKTLEMASKDFDEFIFLDWDCMPVISLPETFWDSFSSKSSVQAHLRSYAMKEKWIKRKGAIWREKNVNIRPCASFIYIKGKEIAEKIYNTWLEDKSASDEKALAIVTDEMMGGWQGVEKYWEFFEPNCFMLFRDDVRRPCYKKELLKEKDLMFMHIHRQITSPFLKEIENIVSIDDRKKYITDKIQEFFRVRVKAYTGKIL